MAERESEVELPAVVQGAIEILRDHLEDCEDIGEACAIEEALTELASEYDEKSDELADEDAAEQLGG